MQVSHMGSRDSRTGVVTHHLPHTWTGSWIRCRAAWPNTRQPDVRCKYAKQCLNSPCHKIYSPKSVFGFLFLIDWCVLTEGVNIHDSCTWDAEEWLRWNQMARGYKYWNIWVYSRCSFGFIWTFLRGYCKLQSFKGFACVLAVTFYPFLYIFFCVQKFIQNKLAYNILHNITHSNWEKN